MNKVHVVDSHTGGEPTRLIIGGSPPLQSGTTAAKLAQFRDEYDSFRSAVVNEPRGSAAVVGALLCPPTRPDSTAGVIFFNNVGYLGMCGHGTIGLIASLAYLGRIQVGQHRIETPVGIVTAELHVSGEVSVSNVPSYRHLKCVPVDVPGFGLVEGDVAWGGNWFFLTNHCPFPIDLRNVDSLTAYAWDIRKALTHAGITGANQSEIDHVELFDVTGRNFVLCPGGAYDRSPCGTGVSAKMACLYSDGKLREREVWKQTGILGSVFEGYVTVTGGEIFPVIKGAAYVNGDSTLILNPHDPFCWGIRP